MPFGSASTSPWYGGAARIGTGGGLHVAVEADGGLHERRRRHSECGYWIDADVKSAAGKARRQCQTLWKHVRMWRSGNASPCHGEDPGPIPGIRSQAPVAESGRRASFRSWCPRGREGPNPSWGTRCGTGPCQWACPAGGRRLGSEGTRDWAQRPARGRPTWRDGPEWLHGTRLLNERRTDVREFESRSRRRGRCPDSTRSTPGKRVRALTARQGANP